jgi:hypothetical protein
MKIEMEIIEKNRKMPENDLRMVPYRNIALEEDGKTMTLSERDQYVMIIENEIQKRRELLLEKRKHLKKVRNQNEFLEEVISDYGKYYGYIVEQKQEQMRALDMLNKYINGLIEKENMTSENLKDAKQEQKKIIYEMKKIKKGLDSFTEK